MAVNLNGDSDSAGVVTGNILAAFVGYESIYKKWKSNLEIVDGYRFLKFQMRYVSVKNDCKR